MGKTANSKWTQIRVSKETRARVSEMAKGLEVSHDRLVECALRCAEVYGYMNRVREMCKAAEDG